MGAKAGRVRTMAGVLVMSVACGSGSGTAGDTITLDGREVATIGPLCAADGDCASGFTMDGRDYHAALGDPDPDIRGGEVVGAIPGQMLVRRIDGLGLDEMVLVQYLRGNEWILGDARAWELAVGPSWSRLTSYEAALARERAMCALVREPSRLCARGGLIAWFPDDHRERYAYFPEWVDEVNARVEAGLYDDTARAWVTVVGQSEGPPGTFHTLEMPVRVQRLRGGLAWWVVETRPGTTTSPDEGESRAAADERWAACCDRILYSVRS